jgi:transcriptional regulator with XRE-family HTH domain
VVVGRHRLYNRGLANGYRTGPKWPDPWHCEWGVVVGDRIRRLRRARNLTLADLATEVHKPEGGHYSPGYISRLERGWATAPLYVYLAIADVLGTDPGRLLGEDAALQDATESEMTLLMSLRLMRIQPEVALARIAKPAG